MPVERLGGVGGLAAGAGDVHVDAVDLAAISRISSAVSGILFQPFLPKLKVK